LLKFEDIGFNKSQREEISSNIMAMSPPQTLLLVDGYNIIGAWSALKKTRDHHGLESARDKLVETLINYSAHQGYTTQIVFDAQYQKTPSSQEKYTPSFSVHYTGFAQTADTYIEKICANFSRQVSPPSHRVIVATSDHAHKLTILGYGAEWMSAQHLANDVELSARQINKKNRSRRPAQGRFLINSLDAKAQKLLSQWRQGIY
jgi:predicted RNA-binding protein with PIN domain